MSRLGKRIGFLALTLVTLLAFAPVLAVFIAYQIADAFGCRVDEGGVYPCVAYGHDIGEQLSTLAVLGWLMLVTFPVMALTALAWFVILVRAALRWHRRSAGRQVDRET